jgi:diaminopimelate epimerase
MKTIPFYKMSGSGNDFFLIDNRKGIIDEMVLHDLITGVCRRKMSVGADGLILIENSDPADFKWRFFNSDGSIAEMCGNGARCAARFAHINGITGPEMTFETIAGEVHAHVDNNMVRITIPTPSDLSLDFPLEIDNTSLNVSSINTGVPHVVVMVDDIEKAKVDELGRKIRFHDRFAPAGTNVNFICSHNEESIKVRTYERGVEGETLACGTGAIASALISALKYGIESPVKVQTKSGAPLYIYFRKTNGNFSDIHLEGDARIIYKGEIYKDAWQDN